jgi:hypothetical protein
MPFLANVGLTDNAMTKIRILHKGLSRFGLLQG